jgi:hypothetical protein
VTGAWRWSLVGVAAAGLLAAALPLLLFWSELPDPIAVHWSADLRPDGAMRKSNSLWPPAALIVGVLLLSLINSGRAFAHGRTGRLALVTFGSAIAAGTNATIVARNLGRTDWSEAGPLTFGMLGIPLIAAAALATLAYLIGARVWRDVRPPAAATGAALPLGPAARAFWTSSASNRWLVAIGAFLLAQGCLLQALLPQLRGVPIWLALHVLVFVVLELFSRIVVAIDARGVAIRYGHLGLWARHVPLGEIAAAHPVTLDALEHGGWGYRGGLRLFGKASIVARSGPAIRLDLHGGRTLFVTVDDAATGAGLLNALRKREPPSGAAAGEVTSSG